MLLHIFRPLMSLTSRFSSSVCAYSGKLSVPDIVLQCHGGGASAALPEFRLQTQCHGMQVGRNVDPGAAVAHDHYTSIYSLFSNTSCYIS